MDYNTQQDIETFTAERKVSEINMRIESLDEYIVFSKRINFSKTASELNLTQSAVSKHIAALEKEVGIQLVERSKPLRLTTAGIKFLDCAQQISDVYRKEMNEFKKTLKQDPPLNILWFDFSRHYDEFLSSLTDISFNMLLAKDEETYFSELENGHVDILTTFDISFDDYLMEESNKRNIEVASVGSEKGALMVMKTNPLASKNSLKRIDLQGVELLIPSRSVYDHWGRCLKSLVGEGIEPRLSLSPIDANIANLKHLNIGNAVFILQSQIIHEISNSRNDVVVFEALDDKTIDLPLALLYKRDNPNPNTKLFVQRAIDYFDAR